MTIKFYPSTMPGEPLEVHEWTGTFGAWLEHKEVDRDAFGGQHPIEITVNGTFLDPSAWDTFPLAANDDVEIRLVAQGGLFKGLGSIIGAIFGAVFGFLLPSSRRGRDYRSPAQGRQLQASEGKANVAKLGDVVPELLGRYRRFPDYLTPPRRHFVNRREQWLEFHACIGPGLYQINNQDVKVGETPFASLDQNGHFQIYEPGASVAGSTTHEHWFTVDEVGGTSSGTAGLELSVDLARRDHTDPPEYVFSGNTIEIPEGTGVFAPGWGPGTIVRVSIQRTKTYAVTLTTNPFPQPNWNTFTGVFSHLLPVENGTPLTFTAGPVVGTYLAQGVSLDSSGQGSLQLWTLPIPPDPEDPNDDGTPSLPVNTVPVGNHAMTSLLQRDLTLTGADDNHIFYSGTPLPEETGPATIRYQSGTVYGEWSSLFGTTPPGETTTTIEIDFFMPQGLAYIEDNGNLSNRSVRIEVQYRDSRAGGPFTSHLLTYTSNTLDQIGYTQRYTVPMSRPEVRIRRVGAASTSTQVQDTVHWYGLKSRLPTRTSYPGWTTMAVRLRSGGRIAMQSENQINLIATRRLPTLQTDGSWGPPVATRDISAAANYVARTIGYTEDNLDLEEFERLHNIWKGRDEVFDFVFDLTTVKEALNDIFRAGFAELTVADGRIRPVRDDVRTQWEQAYSPQNMRAPMRRTFKAHRHDDADGVEVEYTDGETWSQQFVECYLPGSQRLKMVKIKLEGVVSRVQAWRIGIREARRLRYQRWDYAFSTPTDALNSEYMSFVALFDDVPSYGKSSLLVAARQQGGLTVLRSSEFIEWQGEGPHVVAYRNPEGKLVGPFDAVFVDDPHEVAAIIPEALRPVVDYSMELPHLYFGPVERFTHPALIKDIKPSSLDNVSVRAVNYDPRVYADDNNTPNT